MKKPVCWIFDDDDNDRKALIERLSAHIFPDFTYKDHLDFSDELSWLRDVRKDELPDIVIFDAYQSQAGEDDEENKEGYKGYFEFLEYLQWVEKNHPGYQTPHVLFISRDLPYSQACKRKAEAKLKGKTETVFTALDRDEIYLLAMTLYQDNGSYSRFSGLLREDEYRAFNSFSFYNAIKGSDVLPTSNKNIEDYLLRQNLLDLKSVVICFEEGKLSPSSAFRILAKQEVCPDAKGFYAQSKEHIDDTSTPFLTANPIYFSKMIGDACKGHVAFSWQQVQQNKLMGKDSILFLDGFAPEDAQKLADLKGLVILHDDAPGHLANIARSYNLTVFVGAKNEEDQAPFFTEGGVKYLSLKDKNGKPIIFSEGRIVTMDGGACAGLYAGELPLTRGYGLNDADTIVSLYRKAADEIGFSAKAFEATIDTPLQLRNVFRYPVDGVGLIRTEYMLLQNSSVLEALKGMVLFQGDDYENNRQKLSRYHSVIFSDIVREVSRAGAMNDKRYPVTFRLLDVAPEDIFSRRAIPQVIDENFRGCQMGLCLPHLYEDQINAYVDGYADLLATEKDPHAFLKIMVPMVRTPEEVKRIRAMIDERAEERGLSKDQYGFGVMLETLDCVKNISEIAQEISFMSIGSNDLTSEVLGIARNDYYQREEEALRYGKDPSVSLHPKVTYTIVSAVEQAREVNPDLEVNICGDHVIDFDSFTSLYQLGIRGFSMRPTQQELLGCAADCIIYDARLLYGKGFRPAFVCPSLV